MDTLLENHYPHNLDLSLQLTINNGFLGLNDIYRLCKVDKFLQKIEVPIFSRKMKKTMSIFKSARKDTKMKKFFFIVTNF